MNQSDFDFLSTDLTPWVIGPYHSALPGPLRAHLDLDGEIIAAARIERGFLHRGLEKTLELHSWQASMAYADRLDPEGAAFGELALCLAAEEIAEIPIPLRAQSIRVILCELTRISCHLAYIARIASAVGADTMVHYVLRDRERILDLFELLAGARFSLNFMRFGGVVSDVTEGFIERVQETCELLRLRLKEYNDLFSFNQAFLKRTVGIGTVRPELVRLHGLTGPNARAAGVDFDIRKQHPYSGYQSVDFQVPTGRGEAGTPGDSHDRFIVRLREVAQSLEILKHVAETLPPGDFFSGRVGIGFKIPKGEAYVRVESSRGLLGCHLVSDGSEKPWRVQFRAPSVATIEVIPHLIRGSRVEDLPVILASMDIGVAEADR